MNMKRMKNWTMRAAIMLLAVMTTATAGAQNTLVSHIDYCKAGVGSICMEGWVYDSDPNTKLSWELGHGIEVITFVTTDPNETYDGYLPIPHETEYLVRDDVNNAYGLNGKHGFMAMVDFNPYVDLFQGDEGDLSERTFYVKIYGKFNPGTGSQYVVLHSTSVTVRPNFGDGSEDIPYQILDADDWNSIADVLADNDIGPFFSNRYYQLAKDEYPDDGYDEGYDNTTAVTKMWGTSACPFAGHFDGNGQTLNVALNGAMHVAPFAFTNDAVIQNLIVGGTINASQYAGGIVGHGGSGSLTLQNCVCAATISNFSNYAGGILGWCDNLTLTLQNCLFKGSFSPTSGGKYHPIAIKNDVATVTVPAAAFSYYLNTVTPSAELGDHVIKRAGGLPVSTELVDGVWDDPVTLFDGQTYYAAHFTGKTLPYEYGFENNNPSAEGWTMVDCFYGSSNERTGILWSNNGFSHGGNYYFYFNYRSSSPQYLVSPEFSGHTPILVRFYMKKANNPVLCQVGYSTTTPDIDAFTWGGKNTPSTENVWELYERSFPKGTKYIAVKWLPDNDPFGLSLDDFSFTAIDTPSPVNLMAIDVTEYTASPSWEAPPATAYPITGYTYQYKKASDAYWSTEVTVPPTTTSATIDGLSIDTDYDFRVKALYGEHGESIYAPINFTTATELPYECGFENGMGRWSVVDFYSDHGGINTEAAYNRDKSFKFSCWKKTQYLISPRFAGTDDMVISFYYKKHGAVSNSPRFQVGYSTTTSDPSAFTWDEEIKATGAWALYERTFPAGTRFIAVRYNSVLVPTGQPNAYIGTDDLYVDDFSFVENSPYAKPTDLAVNELTDQSVKFKWTAPNGATSYAYQYKKVTDEEWSAQATTPADSVTISGLSANTTYEFRVKALYGGNASNYVAVRFLTEGPAVTSLPFNEGFENGMGGWRISGIGSGIYSKSSNYIHDGNCSFELAQYETLISPRFEVSTPLWVSFYYKNLKKDSTGDYPARFQVGFSETTKDFDNFIWGKSMLTEEEWQKLSIYCPAGTKYVAIRWLDGYPFYLDDFAFFAGPSPSAPHDIAVTNLTAISADITWMGDSELYDVRFRRKPLFFEDFENGLGEWKIVNGENHESHTGIEGQNVWKTDWDLCDFYEFTNHGMRSHSGSQSVMTIPCYIYEDGTYEPFNVDTWLISPRVKLDGTLKFWAVENMNYDVNYEVRVSTTTDDISAFTDIVATPSHLVYGWKENSADLSSYQGQEGYIAFRAYGDKGSGETEGNFLCIDDVGIYLSDWKTGTTRNYVRLSGLLPETEYEFQVRSDFYSTYSAPWSDVVTFTTNRLAPIYDDKDNTEFINDMAEIVAAHANAVYTTMLVRRTLYKDGRWNTLCLPFGLGSLNDTPLDGATVKTLGSTDLGDDGTLTLNFTDATGIEAGKPYLLKWDLSTPDLFIRSAADWETFAQNVNNGTESYEGKLVQLGTDISVSTMAGTADHPFCGTFNGAGYTLNVSISGAEYSAPFRYISGATIRNLKVTGSVNGGQYSAGIVGKALDGTNSISNCWMAASVSGQTHVGGILGHGTTSATTISNCFLNGSLSASYIGALCGGGSAGGTHTVENCWVRGTYPTILFEGGLDLVLTDGGTVSVTNCRQNIGNTAQGDEEGTIVVVGGGSSDTYYADFLGGQWTVNDNGGLALKHITDATDIVSPVFKNVRVSNTLTPIETAYVDFIGITSPFDLTANDRSVLYLGANNTLYYPSAAMTVNACRAYFQLKNGLEMGDGSNVKAFVLNFEGEVTTGVEEIVNSKSSDSKSHGGWFTLDGRRLDGKPTAKGLYIHGNKKVIVK